MATPVKSVQFRDVEAVMDMYDNVKIIPFSIKQAGAINHYYEDDDAEEARQQLGWFLNKLNESGSEAIYTLCLYKNLKTDIDEKTPCNLSWNFRLHHQQVGSNVGGYNPGGYASLLMEIKELKKEVQELKTAGPPNPLGIVGDIMEMEAVQPLIMALGTKVADWITGPSTVGELKRVSGIPGATAGPIGMTTDWRTDPVVIDAIDRLSRQVADLPGILKRLADLAENKPAKFKTYLAMFKMM